MVLWASGWKSTRPCPRRLRRAALRRRHPQFPFFRPTSTVTLAALGPPAPSRPGVLTPGTGTGWRAVTGPPPATPAPGVPHDPVARGVPRWSPAVTGQGGEMADNQARAGQAAALGSREPVRGGTTSRKAAIVVACRDTAAVRSSARSCASDMARITTSSSATSPPSWNPGSGNCSSWHADALVIGDSCR